MAHIHSLFFGGLVSEDDDKSLAAVHLGKPSTVIWNITNRCNLRCEHCYMDAGAQILSDQLSDKESLDLLQQMAGADTPTVFLTGGEPMTRPNFWEILEEAHRLGITTVLSSNAVLIDFSTAFRMAKLGVRYVATSLYGPSEIHDAIVGVPGTHERVFAAIRNLRSVGINVGLKSAVSRETWNSLPYLIAIAKAEGISLLYLCDLITSGRSKEEEENRISSEQWRALADYILRDVLEQKESGVPTLEYDIGALPSVVPYIALKLQEQGYELTSSIGRLKRLTACPVGKGHISINSSGEVLPCQFAQDCSLGNVREIGVAGALQKLAELRNSTPEGICGDCKHLDICFGCRTKAWQKTGNILSEDYTCILTPEERQKIIC